MGQKEILVPYEEIAAYNASRGIDTYNIDSGSSQMAMFTIYWTENGFSGKSWHAGSGPFKEISSEDEVNKMNNNEISAAISTWSGSADFNEKMDWLLSLSLDGCAS